MCLAADLGGITDHRDRHRHAGIVGPAPQRAHLRKDQCENCERQRKEPEQDGDFEAAQLDQFLKVKDIHPGFLSCKNGLVDLKTGSLRPCIPDDNITKSLDISYDVNARANEFDKSDTKISEITLDFFDDILAYVVGIG